MQKKGYGRLASGLWRDGHMDYYRKIFLKIDYDFGQMKNCLLTKYFDVIS